MHTYIFTLILIFVIADFLFGLWLDYLNSKSQTTNLPHELQGIYDDEKYQKSVNYEKETFIFGVISGAFSFLLILGMLLAGGFAYIDMYVLQLTENPIIRALVFFAILGVASDVLNLPFSIYETFVIEERYGFNKTTVNTYILDTLKGFVLSGVLGGVVLSVIVWFYYETTSMFWVYAWLLITSIMVFFAMFYSNLIVPLFNKQIPLEEGDLKVAISRFVSKVGFKLDTIYVIDGSKRSTKANAYFTGLGSKKRIVLYDTLINDLSTEEIVAVLAHEIGHYKHKHTVQGIAISVFQTGLTLFLLSIFLKYPVFSQALGVDNPSFHSGVIVFGILYSPFSMVLGIGMNLLSRKNEYEADAYTKDHYDSEHLISALKKLSVNNLSNLTPHPLYVFFHYSHPTLLQRIRAVKG